MITITETINISSDATDVLKEINKFGNVLSFGDKDQDYIRRMDGYHECVEKELLEKSDGGSEFEFIKFSITNRGQKALKKSKK